MEENLDKLSKGHPRRNAVAQEIRTVRKADADYSYMTDRESWQYVEEFRGVKQLFDYVRTLKTPLVLDIGAGTTRGVASLSHSLYGTRLAFEATVLRHPPVTLKEGGVGHVYHTSVERLRGVQDNSVGCILGMLSIAYSADPALAIQNIDRVLAPGGVLKARFYRIKAPPEEFKPKQAGAFIQELEKRGYDIAVDNYEKGVVLAIKPGGNGDAPSASALLRADAESLMEQVRYLYKESHSQKKVD